MLIYRSTDDVFTALEDNQVQLSTMKASRFVKAFEQEVDKWERTLSHILEVVEMLLTVQRQWMYLEVCRNDSSDISKYGCCFHFVSFIWYRSLICYDSLLIHEIHEWYIVQQIAFQWSLYYPSHPKHNSKFLQFLSMHVFVYPVLFPSSWNLWFPYF